MQPLVSVVMPAYNAEKYICASIDSVLAQSYSNIELVIVDDGSTDNTADIINNYIKSSNKHIIYKRQINGGPARARNVGILLSTGAWISFIDSDDYWASNHLQLLFDKASTDGEVGLVYGSKIFVDKDGNELSQSQQPHWELPEGWIFPQMFANNLMNTSSVIVKRDLIISVNLFDESPSLRICEDYDLFLKLTAISKVCSRPDVKYYYRRHDANITLNNILRARGLITAVENAAKLLQDGKVNSNNMLVGINIDNRLREVYEHAVLCAYFANNMIQCQKFAIEGMRRGFLTTKILEKLILSLLPRYVLTVIRKWKTTNDSQS